MIQRIQKYKLPLIVGAFILLFAAVLIPLLREGEKSIRSVLLSLTDRNWKKSVTESWSGI